MQSQVPIDHNNSNFCGQLMSHTPHENPDKFLNNIFDVLTNIYGRVPVEQSFRHWQSSQNNDQRDDIQKVLEGYKTKLLEMMNRESEKVSNNFDA